MEQSPDVQIVRILEEFRLLYKRRVRRFSVCIWILIILFILSLPSSFIQENLVLFVAYIVCDIFLMLLVFLFLGIRKLQDDKKKKALKNESHMIQQNIIRVGSIGYTLSAEDQQLLRQVLPELYRYIEKLKELGE